MMKISKSLVWFRRDLRSEDNAALQQASTASRTAVFGIHTL
jgi:deoxyribodipyrimidine photolyase